jgi:DNA adenine methylase
VTVPAPALRYHGAKYRLAPWIIANLPNHTTYVEPFAGGAGVLLQKAPSKIEVYNDIDHQVVNFFRELRDHSTELITQLLLTPYARAEAIACREPHPDPLEQARRTYVTSWQLFGGGQGKWHTGWRRQLAGSANNTTVTWTKNTLHLVQIANRLRNIHIECLPAADCITTYDSPDTLFYCDPPYPANTRSKWRKQAYRHELEDADHAALAEQLKQIKGMAIVSSYPSDLYTELYAGWTMPTTTARTERGHTATECLFVSPNAERRRSATLDLKEEQSA